MAHLVKIGNSQGVRIPKGIIEQSGLEGVEFTFELTEEGLLLKPSSPSPRIGWKEAFEQAASHEETDEEREWMALPMEGEEEWQW